MIIWKKRTNLKLTHRIIEYIFIRMHICISDFRVAKESIDFSWSKLFRHHNAERVCTICIKLYARCWILLARQRERGRNAGAVKGLLAQSPLLRALCIAVSELQVHVNTGSFIRTGSEKARRGFRSKLSADSPCWRVPSKGYTKRVSKEPVDVWSLW